MGKFLLDWIFRKSAYGWLLSSQFNIVLIIFSYLSAIYREINAQHSSEADANIQAVMELAKAQIFGHAHLDGLV